MSDGLITDQRPNLISASVLGCRGPGAMSRPPTPLRPTAGCTGAPLSRGLRLRWDP